MEIRTCCETFPEQQSRPARIPCVRKLRTKVFNTKLTITLKTLIRHSRSSSSFLYLEKCRTHLVSLIKVEGLLVPYIVINFDIINSSGTSVQRYIFLLCLLIREDIYMEYNSINSHLVKQINIYLVKEYYQCYKEVRACTAAMPMHLGTDPRNHF